MTLKSLKDLVGARGFEPPTPSLPGEGGSLISLENFRKNAEITAIDSSALSSSPVKENSASKVEKISTAVMRGLRAVERGEVFREMGARVNRMVGPMGIGPQQFWRCRWAKLIEDGDRTHNRYQQVLTDAGRRALETGLFQ